VDEIAEILESRFVDYPDREVVFNHPTTNTDGLIAVGLDRLAIMI
jgi:hypothetical protein